MEGRGRRDSVTFLIRAVLSPFHLGEMMELDPKTLRRFHQQSSSTPNEVRYNCPFCGDTRGKLYVNFKKGQWICFHCNQHGHLLPRDITVLQGKTPQFKKEPKKTFKWETFHNIRGTGLSYLKGRGIDPELAFKWGVRSGKNDLAWRLVFPSKRLTNSKVVSVCWSAHAAVKGMEPKSLHNGTMQPMILAYAPDGESPLYYPTLNTPEIAPQFKQKTAVLVEGPADAFRIFTAQQKVRKFSQFIAVVCLWGKHLSEEAAFDLARGFNSFYVLLDKERGPITAEGETMASLKIMAALNAVSDGLVSRHQWTSTKATHSEANDPAELTELGVFDVLKLALRRTGEWEQHSGYELR